MNLQNKTTQKNKYRAKNKQIEIFIFVKKRGIIVAQEYRRGYPLSRRCREIPLIGKMMKKLTKIIAASAVAAISITTVGATYGQANFSSVKADGNGGDIISVVSPENAKSFSVDNKKITDFYEGYEPNYSSNEKFYGCDEYLATPVTLKWTCDNGKYYQVYLSDEKHFVNAEKYVTTETSLTIDNIIPNREYYWKVKVTDNGGAQKFSNVYTFTPTAYVRTMDISGVQNMRDLGGLTTTDGWAWTYGCFFNDYFCFFDMYSFYEDFYKILYKNKYRFTFAQFHSEQRGADTGFFTLANYLTCKMAWDSSLKMNDLIDEYFDAMYLDAADSMKEYFLECRLWFAKEYGKNGWSESAISERPTSSGSSFDFGTVSGLFAKLDDAYADIQKYKADSAVYKKLETHIDVEWLFPAKVALTLYKNSYNEVTLNEMKSKFKSLCGSLGITRYGEAGTDRIDSFLSTL